MKKIKFNKDFKIKLSIIILSFLILIGILSYQFNSSNVHLISTIIGYLMIAVALFSIKGLNKTIQKIKKPLTIKKYLYLIIISLTACTILYTFVNYIIETIKKFI